MVERRIELNFILFFPNPKRPLLQNIFTFNHIFPLLKMQPTWNLLPRVLFDHVTSNFINTRERLLLERVCRTYYANSLLGDGWKNNLDLDSDRFNYEMINNWGQDTRLRYYERIQSLSVRSSNTEWMHSIFNEEWKKLQTFVCTIGKGSTSFCFAQGLKMITHLTIQLSATLPYPLIPLNSIPFGVFGDVSAYRQLPVIKLPKLAKLESLIILSPPDRVLKSFITLMEVEWSRLREVKVPQNAIIDFKGSGVLYAPVLETLHFGLNGYSDISLILGSPHLRILHTIACEPDKLRAIGNSCNEIETLVLFKFKAFRWLDPLSEWRNLRKLTLIFSKHFPIAKKSMVRFRHHLILLLQLESLEIHPPPEVIWEPIQGVPSTHSLIAILHFLFTEGSLKTYNSIHLSEHIFTINHTFPF